MASNPWGLVNSFCVGFLIALLISDLRNPDSWLRRSHAIWRSTFDLERVFETYETSPNRLRLRARIRFKRRLNSPTVHVFYTPLFGTDRGKRQLAFDFELPNVVRDQEVGVTLATWFIGGPGQSPLPSKWGCDPALDEGFDRFPTILAGGHYLVEVHVGGWWDTFEARLIDSRGHQGWHFATVHDGDARRVLELDPA